MNLFINSPSHYTQEYGVVDEIYNMCLIISQNVDIKLYTECLDTIGITPMIAPNDILNSGEWKEVKYISLSYRMANISLISDYDAFLKGDVDMKKSIIVENILQSLKVIKKRLKGKFDYEQIEQDIKRLVNIL